MTMSMNNSMNHYINNNNKNINKKEKLFYIIMVILALFVYSFYLPQDVMDIDSTQYAEITREMVENQSYFQIRDNGRKYLDKPIMTFWILSVFFNLFGANNIAYRLPSLLMAFISLIGIFKISMLLFKNERKAWLAVLFYSISPALFTMLTSPIIDIYLTTFIILVFLFYFYGIYKNPQYFYLMYLFIGIGFITKGPISLVLPVLAIGGNILFTRNWEILSKIKLLPGIVIAFIPVALWSYFLYLDFGIFGPYFFLFLQSFGRFFSKIYDTGWDPFYFYYTFLFSILPFAIPFIIVLYLKLKSLFRNHRGNWKETYIFLINKIYKKDIVIYLWVFLVLFLLSFSKFRLPQYIFWLIPGACIIGANWLEEYLDDPPKFLQFSYFVITGFILILLIFFPFYTGEKYHLLFYMALLITLIILYYFVNTLQYELLFTFISFLLFYVYIVSSLYPLLIKYQPASAIANIMNQYKQQQKQNHDNILYTYGVPFSHRSYAFYSKKITRSYLLKKKQFFEQLEKDKLTFIIVHENFLDVFKMEIEKDYKKNLNIEIVTRFPYYKVSKPSIYFFNKNKREKYLKYVYLIKIEKLND